MEKITRALNLSRKNSFFLFGPRQVGKSTLIKDLFKREEILIYNLLIPEELKRLNLNPGKFREEVQSRSTKIQYVFIDEVQKSPTLLDEIHYLIEESENPPYFILTGSSARKLKRNQANMLGGRALHYNLSSLTHYEIISSLGEDRFSLYKALELGSLPSVYLSERDTAIQILKSYVHTYLNEEIRIEALVRNLNSFTEFLRFAADANGTIINYSNIAGDIGISSVTVKEYYQILEDTLLGFYLRPLARNLRKSISKHPKFYFFDTGVTRALNEKLSVELNYHTQEFGLVFEHFIIKEFIDLSKALSKDFRFSFYRSDNNAEVDLIIETPQNIIYAIEIKSSNNPRLQELKGLLSFKKYCPQAILCCASLAPKPYQLNEISIYPWRDLMSMILDLPRHC